MTSTCILQGRLTLVQGWVTGDALTSSVCRDLRRLPIQHAGAGAA
jgi:hypothetical protein